jgi:hypothetical protein
MHAILFLFPAFADSPVVVQDQNTTSTVIEAISDNVKNISSSSKNGTSTSSKKKTKKKKKVITIPIEVGLGPTAYHLGGMNGSDRTFHSGVSISGQAIISKKLIRQNKHMIPKEYRKMAMAQEELRISKIWIPESIILSPSTSGTSAFGASFRPVSLSLLRAKKNRGLNVDLGARLTYAYINSDDPEILQPHFIGLGIDGKAEFRIPLKKKTSLGIGWTSHAYIPQEMLSGGTFNIDPSNWHVGQAFVKYYYRFPYQYRP